MESFLVALLSTLTLHVIHPCQFEETNLSAFTITLKGSLKPISFLLPFHRNIALTLNVTAGEHDLSQVEPGEQTLAIETIIIHPQFSIRKPMNYDIALLKMAGTFQFGK